ncbi:hypothetical protein PAXRUDRAFT_178476 [Paxillus rubicundulus Ve08.2h10]|uniref:Uncharacterized protein n=1 Tax=Paxillus rubicundulus Ve08.2h10 TaxID=930991 RepID=A0A0D0D0V0_9AGAM|nr:hypothetical protein PAXRUDRAFT_178476 [Paxillus rubicundulus Ve08.2h10]
MAQHIRFQTPIGGWSKTISHNTSQATVCSDNHSMLIASTLTLASILPVTITIDINMSPPNQQFKADPAMQINVNMSPTSCSAVPTLPSPVKMLNPPGCPELSEAERMSASTYVLRPCPSSVWYLRSRWSNGGAE